MNTHMHASTRLALVFTLVILVAGAAGAQNLVTNGTFASNTSGWVESTNTDHVQWDPKDASNSGSSGSIWLFAIGSAGTIEVVQCIAPYTAGSDLSFKGRVNFPSFDTGYGNAQIGLRFFASPACGGSSTGTSPLTLGSQSQQKDAWLTIDTDLASGPLTPPSGSSSAQIFLRIERVSGSTFTAYFDDVVVTAAAPPPTSTVTLFGPTDAKVEETRRFRAVGENCDGDTSWYWEWSAPGGNITNHGAHDIISVRWPVPGSYVVTATHPNCGGASGTKAVTVENRGPYVWVWPGAPYMFEPAGTDLAHTSYTAFNWGDESTTITMDQEGNFFTQSPQSFTLAPWSLQPVELRGKVAPVGLHRGRSFLLGTGVPPSLDEGQLVQMLVFETESSAEAPQPESTRIDTTAGGPQTVRFDNPGTVPVDAIVSSDQPWIVPASGKVTIPAGGSANVEFTIDRSKRPDADAPLGSVFGRLVLAHSAGSAAGKAGARSPAQSGGAAPPSLVTVVDTAAPAASETGIPPLGENELALFIPGVGHVDGSVGTFISDLSFVNLDLFDTLDDIDLYFKPVPGSTGTGTQKASLSSLAPNQPIALADLVHTVFDNTSQIGSLQLRASNVGDIGVTATVFNKSNPAGSYGTTIPVFRSDRGAGSSDTIYLTGLARSATSHTNLYIQEVSGSAVGVTTRFLGEAGNVVSTRSDEVPAFALVGLNNVIPEGAVSAALTVSGGAGKFFAYATPVDDLSGDTWAVSDWSRQFGYSRSEPVVIPVTGALRGGNQTFFRTDAAIMNTGSTTATGTLRYYDRTGPEYDEQISLAPQETLVYENITESLFGITSDTVGHMTFTPSSGEVVITSRNFTTEAGGQATYGSGVPTLAASSALDAGDVTRFGGIADTARGTIEGGAPATFRTNFGMVETSGNSVTVRVTLHFDIPGTLASQRAVASHDYVLGAHEFLLVQNVARAILGEDRETILGDLSNLEVEFEHVAGTGRAMVFTSSVDNGTGDSILSAQ